MELELQVVSSATALGLGVDQRPGIVLVYRCLAGRFIMIVLATAGYNSAWRFAIMYIRNKLCKQTDGKVCASDAFSILEHDIMLIVLCMTYKHARANSTVPLHRFPASP